MTKTTIDLTQWIKHDGGECPVDGPTPVQVLFRNGHVKKGLAGTWRICWVDDELSDDIVAYRLADVTELRQGDHVALDGLSEQQYRDLLAAFLAAGADYHDSGNSAEEGGFLFWDGFNDVWVTSFGPNATQRQLTYQQVMDVSKAVEPKGEPDKPEWDGKGFPPIGVPFEFSRNGFSVYEPRVMLFNDGITCLMAHRDYLANRWHYKCDDPHLEFRPIRSEERQAVDGMVNVLLAHHGHPDEAGSYVRLARTLYRAGYRKQETPQ